MNRYSYHRRQSDQGPRWRIEDPQGKVVALCENEEKAALLTEQLSELRELRVLLAVASNTLAPVQASAILRCEEKDLKRRIDTCLVKGWK